MATNRGIEKSQEWLARLAAQDIMTVGDLRDLHDEDWSNLGLTVFASRALKNALYGKVRGTPGNQGSGTGGVTAIGMGNINAASPKTVTRTTSLSGSRGGGVGGTGGDIGIGITGAMTTEKN